MNFYALFPLIAFFANSFLGVYVVYKDPASRLNRIYSVLVFALALWMLSDFLIFVSSTAKSAMVWNRVEMLSVAVVPAVMLHFFIEFVRDREVKNRWAGLLYMPAVFFGIIAVFTDMLSKGFEQAYWGYAIIPGKMYFLIALYAVLYSAAGIIVGYVFYRKSGKRKRIYAKMLMLSAAIPIVGGVITEIVFVFLGIDVMPMTSSLTTISVAVVSYAIIRHKMMSPERFSIGRKIMISFLIISIIPLVVGGYFSFAMINYASTSIAHSINEIGTDTINDTTKFLEELGTEFVKEKAIDVSREMEIFIKAHPDIDFFNNSELKSIAVQKVGRSGYTAVHDIHAVNRFHVNPDIVGTDLHSLADKLPDFWKIVEKSLKEDAWGYYHWTDADGKFRKKYMYCRNVQSIGLVVCATTYIDEFSMPVQSIGEKMRQYQQSVRNDIGSMSIQIGSLILGMMFASFVVVFIISFYIARSITDPIVKLKKIAERIGRGEKNVKIYVKTKDEVGMLASAFRRMLKDLKKSEKRLKEYAEHLEDMVEERTKELKQKVKDLEDAKLAMLNMMEDVDNTNKELIKTQEKLKQSLKELKIMDAKKDEFISIAAHELKTPLTAIHGFSQLLKNEKILDDRKSVKKYMDIIDKETKRLANLVTNILELSRIDLGTIKFSRDEIDLKDFLGSLEKEMSVNAKKKGLSLKFFVEKNIGKIVTDREKFTQVLINLINNAIKYTPKGGIEVRAFSEGDSVHFSVKDTGIGIAKEHINKIFGRFYQVDSSYTRKAGGTGLGLSLCKEYVEKMGGRIWVESEVGKGSTFHFILPRTMPENKERAAERKARERLEQSQKISEQAKSVGAGLI